MAVNVPSYLALLAHELAHPFYLFQLFSVAIWFSDEYEGTQDENSSLMTPVYAGCIVFISIIAALTNAHQTRVHLERLHSIQVMRNAKILLNFSLQQRFFQRC